MPKTITIFTRYFRSIGYAVRTSGERPTEPMFTGTVRQVLAWRETYLKDIGADPLHTRLLESWFIQGRRVAPASRPGGFGFIFDALTALDHDGESLTVEVE